MTLKKGFSYYQFGEGGEFENLASAQIFKSISLNFQSFNSLLQFFQQLFD